MTFEEGHAKVALTSALLLASALWAADARAASVTVGTAGQLATAFANAQAGDVITIQNGTYNLAAVLEAKAVGTAGAPILVQAATAHGVVLSAANLEAAVRVSGPYWTFSGVDFAGGTFGVRVIGGGDNFVVTDSHLSGSDAGVRADCGGSDAVAHCDRGTVVSCDITGAVASPSCTFAGVEIVGGIDWTVHAVRVHDVVLDPLACTPNVSYGVVARGNAQNFLVEVANITGVTIGIGMGPPTDPCAVRGSAVNGTVCNPPTTCAVQAALVINSVITQTTDDGVLLQNACGVKLHNLTLWDDGTDSGGRKSVELRSSSVADVSNTILNVDVIVGTGTTLTGTGNLILPTPTDTSWFLDVPNGNFRLLDGVSPIDHGVTLNDVPTDFDGVARPQGSAYDVGAFERPLAGYPDGGIPMFDGGIDGGGSGGVSGAVGGPGGGMTSAGKDTNGCQCNLGLTGGGGVGFLLVLLLLAVVALRPRPR